MNKDVQTKVALDLDDEIEKAMKAAEEAAEQYTTVTFPYIEAIFKKLPISYYLGRDITAELSPTESGSYYNWREDRIVISGPAIATMMTNLKKSEDIEMNIRSCLYHEISHVLMTPSKLFDGYDKMYADSLNIFEDERMETLLWDKYYGVDFKRNIMELNDWHGEEPKDAMSAFYNTVRFRQGEEKDLDEVNAIITKYAKITRPSPTDRFEDYKGDIVSFFKRVTKKWLEKNKHDELEKEQPDYDHSSESKQNRAVEKILEREAAAREEAGKKLAGEGQATMTDMGGRGWYGPSKPSKSGPDTGKMVDVSGMSQKVEGESDEEAKAMSDLEKKIKSERQECHPNVSSNPMPKKPQDILSTTMNKFIDDDLTNNMKQILDNFLARTKNNGAAIERYSGVLNPRSLVRDDWRIFTYKSKGGPIKGYDKFHLNLFIDTSGSYGSNEDATNTILKSLDTLEKQYDFFSFDLVTCQVGETLRDKNQRYIEAYGGNFLDKNVWKIFDKIQDPKALNYNIALFDGDAYTDCRGSLSEAEKNFGVFNSSRCSIISDRENAKYISRYAPQAHTVIVGDGGRRESYSSLLFKNILTAMNRALL